MSETERLLRYALVPVEPPGALSDRLEQRLTQIRGAAAEELGHLELRAMRNPRNWARPVAAALIGGLAGGALVLVRARQRQRGRRDRRLRAVRGAADDLRGRLRG